MNQEWSKNPLAFGTIGKQFPKSSPMPGTDTFQKSDELLRVDQRCNARARPEACEQVTFEKGTASSQSPDCGQVPRDKKTRAAIDPAQKTICRRGSRKANGCGGC